jgi:hypothetical protein
MHPLIYIFAHHVDSITLVDGDYELISDQAVEIPEDLENAIEGLTEVPNQSLENTNCSNPVQEGKPRCITQYLNFTTIRYLYIISFIKSRS